MLSISTKIRTKAQTWALDAIIATFIFIAGFMIFYYMIGTSIETGKTKTLSREGGDIAKRITATAGTGDNFTFITENIVDVKKLNSLSGKNYSELKSALSPRTEFCIYLEDEEGNIIPINSTMVGIGSPDFIINGIPCGK